MRGETKMPLRLANIKKKKISSLWLLHFHQDPHIYSGCKASDVAMFGLCLLMYLLDAKQGTASSIWVNKKAYTEDLVGVIRMGREQWGYFILYISSKTI